MYRRGALVTTTTTRSSRTRHRPRCGAQLHEFSPQEPSPPAASPAGLAGASPAGAAAPPAAGFAAPLHEASPPLEGWAAAPSWAAGGSDEPPHPTPKPAIPAAVAITSSLFFNPVFMSCFPPDEPFSMCSDNLRHTVRGPKIVVRHWFRSSRSAAAVHQRRAHPQQGGTLPHSGSEWEMPRPHDSIDGPPADHAAKSGVPNLCERL
jgi:hypothetical protein